MAVKRRKIEFGKVYLTKETPPPTGMVILVFFSGIFTWVICVFDAHLKKYYSDTPTTIPQLVAPPFNLFLILCVPFSIAIVVVLIVLALMAKNVK
jgi:hypothetical protein